MASSGEVTTGRALMEVVSANLGGVAVVVGLVHFGNVWALNAFRRPGPAAGTGPAARTWPPRTTSCAGRIRWSPRFAGVPACSAAERAAVGAAPVQPSSPTAE